MKIDPRFVATGIAAVAWLALAGCSKKDPRAGAAPETAPVTVASVARHDIPVEVRAIGHVEPFTTVNVKARVGGQVTRVGFQEGQNVRKGDLLFQIDPRPYQAALDQARAQLERDRALARNAEEEVKRYTALVEKDYVTREQFDATRANAAAAMASARADEAAVENARSLAYYAAWAVSEHAREAPEAVAMAEKHSLKNPTHSEADESADAASTTATILIAIAATTGDAKPAAQFVLGVSNTLVGNGWREAMLCSSSPALARSRPVSAALRSARVRRLSGWRDVPFGVGSSRA